jgi:hypothetical protein
MNGTLLNGEQVRGTTFIQSNDEIEIGSYHFLFTLAEHRAESAEEDDPLARRGHTQQSPALTPLPEPSTAPEQAPQLPFGPGLLRLPGKQKE